jgi:type I restriction enzyme, S subunit
MNAERLLAHYERIADAPDAVARLRRFILDLAVRGTLVPQDANDEPASELLKRIAKEKGRLGIKVQRVPLEPDEAPFDLPIGWSWSRIGEICSKTGSGSTPRGGKEVYKPSGVPFLRSQNVYDDGLRLTDVAYIDLATHERMSGTRVAPRDLLLNITGGSMGRCCLVPGDFEEANISQHVAIIRVALRGIEGFLHRLVLSPYFQAFVFDEQTGAGRGGLPKNRMDLIAVALPPLAEQHRIVAKVDELMGLCDRLEAARAGREAVRDQLAASGLARLNAPDPETFQDDARFALDALPALTTRPDQIKRLRQTILNLAVRGKLVTQDATDEPALELLKRIAREKLDQAGVPQGWLRAKLGSILDFQYGKGLKASERLDEGPVPVFGSNGIVGFTDEPLTDRPAIIVGRKGSAGALNLCDGPSWTTDVAYYVEAPSFLDLRFMLNALAALDLDKLGKGVKPGLSRSEAYDQIIALPPLAEQHRIVAKVDALMALCDRLEASLTAIATTRRRLLDALLAEALAPMDVHELEAAE